MARSTSSGPVARGPVPRERSLSENRTPTRAVFRADRSIARDRPSPYRETEPALQTVARGPVPRDHTREKNLFRSFRSCMSIETPTKETLRSFRSLICSRCIAAENIKDLKDLEETASARAIDIKDLKNLKANPFRARSAGDRPPRASDPRKKRTPAPGRFPDRGTARDRPSP